MLRSNFTVKFGVEVSLFDAALQTRDSATHASKNQMKNILRQSLLVNGLVHHIKHSVEVVSENFSEVTFGQVQAEIVTSCQKRNIDGDLLVRILHFLLVLELLQDCLQLCSEYCCDWW